MTGRRGCRAIAAVEFALVVPVLLIVLIGGTDLGLKVWAKGTLANAMGQGAYYAFLAGPSVTASAVKSFVQAAAPGTTATVSGPTAECTLSAPTQLVAAPSSGNCTDGTKPGTYLTISATKTAANLGGGIWDYGGTTVSDQVSVRLQ